MNVFIFISLEIRNVIWLVSWYDLLFKWEVSTGPLTRSVEKSKRIVYHRYQFLSEIPSLYTWSLGIACSGTQSLAHARQELPLQPHQVFHTDLFQNSSTFHVDPPGSLAFSSPVLWRLLTTWETLVTAGKNCIWMAKFMVGSVVRQRGSAWSQSLFLLDDCPGQREAW